MTTYFSSLQDIESYTHQLQHQTCPHCKQSQQLLSHGYIRKKRAGSIPVGKRIFCSNRQRSGCGRTSQLYLASVVPALHYPETAIIAFFLAFCQGTTIDHSYRISTGAFSSRNAYRWLHKAMARLSLFRAAIHQPLRSQHLAHAPSRRSLLHSTFSALIHAFGQPLCSAFQLTLHHAFL